MKGKILLISLLFIAASISKGFGQHTYAEWAKHIVGNESSSFNNILFDGEAMIANGHWFLGAEFDGLDLPYHIGSNALIVKMDLEGNMIWHSTMTGDGYDSFFDLALDSENNIIAAGWSSANDYIEVNGVTVYEPDMEWTSRGVVAKFSGVDGSLIWIKFINPNEEYYNTNLNKVTVDADDNVYIAGYSNSGFEIDGVEFPYTQEGWGSITFLAKLDSDGAIVWGKQFHFVEEGDSGWSFSRAIKVKDEQIFFGFQYSKPINVGDDVLPYEGEGYFDWIGLVKMSTSDGEVLKTAAYGSGLDQNLASIEIDNDGNILVAGFFTSESNFSIGGVSPMAYGEEDGYVAKLNSELELIWLRSMGSEFSSRCFNISFSPDNRIFVGGGFDSYTELYFEGHKLLNAESPTNSLAMFQVVLDEDGIFEKAFALHGDDIYSIVEYKSSIALENDIVMAVGASVDNVTFVEGTQFFSDHWAGFFIKWDLSKEFFKVFFEIQDEDGNPLDNAVVMLDGMPNPFNMHSFYQIESGQYSYSITLDGFESIEGSVEVIDQDVMVNITMLLATYNVLFEVKDQAGNVLENAIVTLGSTSNEANDYAFSQIAPGEYAYGVSLEGFITSEGQVNVVNQDLVVTVTMLPINTSVISHTSLTIKMFPNPARTSISITSEEEIELIAIFDTMGRLLHKQSVGTNSTTVNTQELPSGVYLVRIDTRNGVTTRKLQVIN